MNALKKWNGGVILISHDERFITSVANEVGWLRPTRRLTFISHPSSYGYVPMGRRKSSEATCRPTRYVTRSISHHFTDKPQTPAELDCKQHQSKAVELPRQCFNIMRFSQTGLPKATPIVAETWEPAGNGEDGRYRYATVELLVGWNKLYTM